MDEQQTRTVLLALGAKSPDVVFFVGNRPRDFPSEMGGAEGRNFQQWLWWWETGRATESKKEILRLTSFADTREKRDIYLRKGGERAGEGGHGKSVVSVSACVSA